MKEFLLKLYHLMQIKTFIRLISLVIVWCVLLGVMVTLNHRKALYYNEKLENRKIVYMKLKKDENLGSYLFTDNLGKQYRLGANSTKCFDENKFYKEVHVADTLAISTTELEWSKECPLIYSIRSNNKSYVTLGCTREKNQTGILSVLITIGFYMVTVILVFNAIHYLVQKILSLINNKRQK